MHIAFAVSYLGGYGAGQVVYQLARGLSERGHKVDVMLLQTIIHRHLPQGIRVFLPGDAPDRLTEERFAQMLARAFQLRPPSRVFQWRHVAKALRWDPRALPSRRLLRHACAIASYLDVERPDCVLSQSTSMWATFLGCCMADKQPAIIPTADSNVRHRGRRFRLRARYLFPQAVHFIGVSRGASEGLATEVGVPREKITTIYNPVVTPDLHAKAAEQPNHPWLSDDGTPVLLAVGRLEKEKDHPTLVKAFARLASRRACRLIVLGEGSKRTEVEGLVKKLDLTDRVSLPGWVENPLAFMARASLFVLSSIYEGLPTVLVEALACGCPCVSTDCPSGPAEILRNGDIGPLVPVGDEAALAEAMEQVLDQPPDKQMLQQRAMDFSTDQAVAAYENLLSEFVG